MIMFIVFPNTERASARREEAMATVQEHSVMRKVAWRLVPFLGLAYFINALDPFNISIAALTMNKALGLSATTYGLGAGAFFWSYVLFQVPANAVLTRLGARRWLAFTMVMWGVCSAGTAFVTDATTFRRHPVSFGCCRGRIFPRCRLVHDPLVSGT